MKIPGFAVQSMKQWNVVYVLNDHESSTQRQAELTLQGWQDGSIVHLQRAPVMAEHATRRPISDNLDVWKSP